MSKDETSPCDDCIYKDRPGTIFQDACDGCHPNGYPYYTKQEQGKQMSNELLPCPFCKYCFLEGGPKDNKMNYCCYCGGELIQEVGEKEKIEILEALGWVYQESSDGTGDMFMYWDDPTKEMPEWCSDNTTSCECLDDVWQWYCEAN